MDASEIDANLSLGQMWKPAGKHDSVRELLIRLGLKKYTKTFRKQEILSVALLRSMTAMGTLRANLREMRMEDADIRTLSKAVLAQDSMEEAAAVNENAGTALVRVAPAAEADAYFVDDDTDDEPDPMALPEKPPDTKHLIHLSKAEYDEILKWSDDEDMTTAHGRFRHRQKQNYQTEHDSQYFMKDEDEGAIVDVSKGPRNILKKLLRGATGWQNPVEGFEVDLCYTARFCHTVDGPTGPTCGPLADVFDERYAEGKEPLRVVIGSPELFPPLAEAVETMREGERAEITIHPRVAYGRDGHAALGIPPDAFLVYTVCLLKAYEVTFRDLP